jgi:uncharacterized membrane protein
MVLVAFMLIVLIGFIGLAVDGGRLYWERRILQNSVDAAALAASDNYQDSQSVGSSMHAAAIEYAANEKIYGTSSASPSWTASSVDVSVDGEPVGTLETKGNDFAAGAVRLPHGGGVHLAARSGTYESCRYWVTESTTAAVTAQAATATSS